MPQPLNQKPWTKINRQQWLHPEVVEVKLWRERTSGQEGGVDIISTAQYWLKENSKMQNSGTSKRNIKQHLKFVRELFFYGYTYCAEIWQGNFFLYACHVLGTIICYTNILFCLYFNLLKSVIWFCTWTRKFLLERVGRGLVNLNCEWIELRRVMAEKYETPNSSWSLVPKPSIFPLSTLAYSTFSFKLRIRTTGLLLKEKNTYNLFLCKHSIKIMDTDITVHKNYLAKKMHIHWFTFKQSYSVDVRQSLGTLNTLLETLVF